MTASPTDVALPTSDDPLVQLLIDLCAQVCVTGEEGPIADWMADRYGSRGDVVMRVANSVVVATPEAEGDDRPVVLLVGHHDVVPPTPEDVQPRLETRPEGEVLVARGTSDMKAGLAVAMDCFEDPALRDGAFRLVLISYGGEEGPVEANELRDVLDAVPGLTEADLAIVLEPTDLEVQLGCMGALHALVTFPGRAAHSARPWHGDNALTRAGAWLAAWRDREPEDITVDGLVFREVVNPTQAWTDNARNVIPDAFTVNVNHRFAPDKTLEEAEAKLRDLIGVDAGAPSASSNPDGWSADGVPPLQVEVVDRAPACPPRRDAPLVAAFIDSVGATVTPKQAWTDVARFAEVGVPALNYGPGLGSQAHQAGEHVPLANLGIAREALARFLRG